MAGKKGMKMVNRKPMSEETKRKISETVKKRWTEKEYREKVSKAHKHPLLQEWKDSISWSMIGVKKSEETKKKMSKYHSNRPKEHELKFRESWKRQWNSLTKAQQLERLSNWIEAGHSADKTFSLKPSSIEIKLAKQLDEIGIRYIQQKHISNGIRNFYLDFYIPSLRLVIECNGDYWHNLPDRRERDKELKEYVESTGRRIIFIWEHEINDDWFWVGDYFGGGDVNA